MLPSSNIQKHKNPIKVYKESKVHLYDGVEILGKFYKFCLSSISHICEHASKVGGSPLK